MTSHRRGVLYAAVGTLVLTPDTLFMRLSGLDPVAMTGWRGVLMGLCVLGLWLLRSRRHRTDLGALATRSGLLVTLCYGLHMFLFSLGVAVAPVAYVLMGLATMPVVSALLSRWILHEASPPALWPTTGLVSAGLAVAVFAGHESDADSLFAALGGAMAGLGVAVLMSVGFVCYRARPELPVTLPMGAGALSGGMIAMWAAGAGGLMAGTLWPIVLTSTLVLPVSFLLLNSATRLTRTATVSLLVLLETVLGPFWLWLVLDEPVTPGVLAGGALVLVSLGFYLSRQQDLPG